MSKVKPITAEDINQIYRAVNDGTMDPFWWVIHDRDKMKNKAKVGT